MRLDRADTVPSRSNEKEPLELWFDGCDEYRVQRFPEVWSVTFRMVLWF